MKKIVSIALVALMVLSLVSCSSGKANYDFDLSEYITVGEYKGVEISQAEIDSEYEEEVDDLISDNTTTATIEREVAAGDSVNIAISSVLDGETYTGGYSKIPNGALIITAGESTESSYIIDICKEVVGYKPGETFEIDYTFADDYEDEELQGKDIKFTISVESASEAIIPEFNDEFVAEQTDYATVEEYKEATIKEIKEDLAWNVIYANSKVISYPEANVKEYYDSTVEYYEAYASYYSTTLSSFVSTYYSMDLEEFLDEVISSAKTQVKQQMIFNAIARAEGLEVTDEIYDAKVADYVEEYDMDDVEELESSYGKDSIESSMLYELVLDLILENAVIVD